MSSAFYLAWKYLRFHWMKTTVLMLSIGLVIFIPLGMNHLINQSAQRFTSRAVETPLVIGARGSATDLTLNTLYFKEPVLEPLNYSELQQLQQDSISAIPIYSQFEAKGFRIVGTSLEYLQFRDLSLASGRQFVMLGECVMGAEVARATGASQGSTVITTPAGAFDVAGSFPLKMTVAGILSPTGTPDDKGIFVDLKTSWIIAGLAHGHQDLVDGPDSLLLTKSDTLLVANPSVLSYTEITAENLSSFHFHGDISEYPLDAILVIPENRRQAIQLRGKFEERTDNIQMIVPLIVINDLVGTMFSVRDTVVAAGMMVVGAALAIMALVFWLSLKIRQKEINTMRKIGGANNLIFSMLGIEIGLTIGVGILLAILGTLWLSRFGLPLVESLLTN